ncbi:MAG TPA: aminopeptidase P family N-terminal domain-containing protein, partial [Ilumatobacteraceae bacterium]|nr:aminopeptidase P family N-terminal domain-containing protein [Ilumatobacteraceae bacterium]
MNTSGAATPLSTQVYATRMERARELMAERDVDVLLLSLGLDLPYISGYTAMPLERLTMLVVPREGAATMVIPRLEAPRVTAQPGVFDLHPWNETENPVEIVANLVRAGGPVRRVAVGDQTWARFVVELIPLLAGATFMRADVVSALRLVKDQTEIDAL